MAVATPEKDAAAALAVAFPLGVHAWHDRPIHKQNRLNATPLVERTAPAQGRRILMNTINIIKHS